MELTQAKRVRAGTEVPLSLSFRLQVMSLQMEAPEEVAATEEMAETV
jgi:hypothetical protein